MLSKLVKLAALVVALTVVPALAGTSSAVAQQSGEKSTARQVEELANKGAQAYGQERYRDAIGFFEEAYALQPVPNLLYNIGRCHEKLEEYEKARVELRTARPEYERLEDQRTGDEPREQSLLGRPDDD